MEYSSKIFRHTCTNATIHQCIRSLLILFRVPQFLGVQSNKEALPCQMPVPPPQRNGEERYQRWYVCLSIHRNGPRPCHLCSVGNHCIILRHGSSIIIVFLPRSPALSVTGPARFGSFCPLLPRDERALSVISLRWVVAVGRAGPSCYIVQTTYGRP